VTAVFGRALPRGYERIDAVTLGTEGVVLQEFAESIAIALATSGTLHRYASSHAEARGLEGRGMAFAAPLPAPHADTRVVVRHSRHGGLLAPITGDLFLSPTRAPRELRTALRLAELGVRTPRIVAALTYAAGPLLRRSDVATREVAASSDLAALLLRHKAGAERAAAIDAAGRLVAALTRTGARHPDLNLKNVLCEPTASGMHAWILDVDRVVFRHPGDPRVTRANLARLTRSLHAWRARRGLAISDSEISSLEAVAMLGS
jgi:3-deoxy-D-manno-octulosonic acid kinase